MSSKRYYELTEAERLALTPDEMLAAVKVEAISRGIRPPTPLRDIVTGFSGFQIPADSIKVYEIATRESQHSSPEGTGLCFKTEEQANAAIVGGLVIKNQYVGGKGNQYQLRLYCGEVLVLARYIGADGAVNFGKSVTECEDGSPSEGFTELCEECENDQSRIRQAAYNKEVRKRKRVEYVQLAKGDLDVAAAFWRKVESGDFPNEEGL